MNLTAPLKVMIVEDQIAIRQQLEYYLRLQYNMIVIGSCGTVHEAVKLMRTIQPDLLFLDTELPDGTGFDILEHITGKSRVIFLANHWEYAVRIIWFGSIDSLLKPFDNWEIAYALRRVLNAGPLKQIQIAVIVEGFRAKQIPAPVLLGRIQIDNVAKAGQLLSVSQ